MMTKSASETTLKTSSLTGTDNIEIPQRAAEAAAAEALTKKTFMDITGRPGMAEVAGWHAHDAVTHGMSVAEAVQSAIKHFSMWTWATPAARAKRAASEAEAGKAKPPPLVLKVPEFKEITDPGALAPSLEWLAAAPAPLDLGGAYGAGGEAEPVEGEPATPTLLDTWEEGPQPEFEVIRVTAEDLELKERNQARSAARAAGH
jgi:hypothetical protein